MRRLADFEFLHVQVTVWLAVPCEQHECQSETCASLPEVWKCTYQNISSLHGIARKLWSKLGRRDPTGCTSRFPSAKHLIEEANSGQWCKFQHNIGRLGVDSTSNNTEFRVPGNQNWKWWTLALGKAVELVWFEGQQNASLKTQQDHLSHALTQPFFPNFRAKCLVFAAPNAHISEDVWLPANFTAQLFQTTGLLDKLQKVDKLEHKN